MLEEKLAELEQKNMELKEKLADYKDDGNEDWNAFKVEFSHDMNALGKAFSDLTVKNTN
jgi:NAD-dependent DNA ligase